MDKDKVVLFSDSNPELMDDQLTQSLEQARDQGRLVFMQV